MAIPGGVASEGEYAPDRLLHYRAFLSLPRLNLARWLDPLLQSLPYRLGESTAEISVPYAFDDAFCETADRATDDLADLFRRRRESEQAARAPQAGPAIELEQRRLLPPSYSSSPFPAGALARTAALSAVRLDPSLDFALLDAWLRRGQGGALLDQLAALFARACEQDYRAGGSSAYLALEILGFLRLAEAAKVRGKPLITRLYPFERLEKSFGFAFFALGEAALEAAIRPLRSRPGFDADAYRLLVRSMVSPLAFCSVRPRALQNDVNPWGLSQALADALDHLWLVLLEEDPDPLTAEARLLSRMRSLADVRLRAARGAGILLLRRGLFDWLAIYDGVDPELSGDALTALASDEVLFTHLTNPKALQGRLQKFARGGRKSDAAGEAATAALLDSLKLGPERDDALPELAAAYTCLALDRAAVGAVDAARAQLRDRREEFTREQLIADYLSGRLYRLSSDGRPIRRALARQTQGHLFVDLKGFTQRTFQAKEIVMAEFLRTEFYQPILIAASQRSEGSAGEPQLILQNLLGDAAVFSGEVPALIDLARAVQAICRAYSVKLRSRTSVSPEEIDGRRRELESKAREQMGRLRADASLAEAEIARKLAVAPMDREQVLVAGYGQRAAELSARLRQATARRDVTDVQRAQQSIDELRAEERQALARLEQLFGAARDQLIAELLVGADRRSLRESQHRAEDLRSTTQAQLKALDEELRSSRGGGLDAGLFIGYGTSAEIVTLTDPVFGTVKVAVAEKINEAARGTARNAMLRSKLEALVAKARTARGNPAIEYPFRVFVDSAYTLHLPAEVGELIDDAVSEKDPNKAREAARWVAEVLLRDLARSMSMGDGQPTETLGSLSDIYNTGEALSAEALTAYLESTAHARSWFRKLVRVDELTPEISGQFCFPAPQLDLVVSVPHEGDLERALIFRRAGQVQFKGFEAKAPTAVWELLRPDSAFCALLGRKHLGAWIAQARGRPTDPLPA